MNKDLAKLYFDETQTVAEVSTTERLIFLLVRHNGCTYCRKSLAAFKEAVPMLLARGLRPIVVHMGSELESQGIKDDYALGDTAVISDPKKEFYKAFGARRGSMSEVIGPKVIAKGLFSGDLIKHGLGSVKSDPYQLGGAYYVHKNQVEPLHIPKNTSDTENWPLLIGQIPEK